MLTGLFINNIVLIDKLDLQLDKSFCVLTGETGAGKSILLDALGLALGGRASSGLLRHGKPQGFATAIFDISDNNEIKKILEEQGIEADSELNLRRVIYADGKTKAFLNDTPVSVGLLSSIAEFLVEIHGQHDQKGLMEQKTHISTLDLYGKLEDQLSKVSEAYGVYKNTAKTLQEFEDNKEKFLAEQDFFRHVIKEITLLSPAKGLEEELAQKRELLMNREKLATLLNQATASIYDSNIEGKIRSAQNSLAQALSISDKFSGAIEALERASIELGEATSEIDKITSQMDSSTENLDEIEERLFGLREAAKKYNVTTDSLSEYCEQVKEKLSFTENQDVRLDELRKQLAVASKNYSTAAKKLSDMRKKSALVLEKAIANELTPLKMGSTIFKVNIEELDENNWSEKGIDKVAFLASTNPGQPPSPIAKIASGGELSRFMLAMKVALSGVKSVPTIIFDEIDTGVGGAVAEAIGKRLELLGKALQVFAITHQPQVAARGNYHIKIYKTQNAQGTTTTAFKMSDSERQEELARMLAGEEISNEARAAAVKLLEAV